MTHPRHTATEHNSPDHPLTVETNSDTLPRPTRLGAFLIDHHIISKECLKVALFEQQHHAPVPAARDAKWMLGEIIARLNICHPASLRVAIGEFLQCPVIDLGTLIELDRPTQSKALQDSLAVSKKHRITAEMMVEHLFLPFAYSDRILSFAMTQPQDLDLLDTIQNLLPSSIKVKTYLALGSDILSAIQSLNLYHHNPSEELEQLGRRLERNRDSNQQHEILISMIDKLIESALTSQASDIHFVPDARLLLVLFRIDGVLQVRYRFPPRFAATVSVRVKVLADMDISESRLPQDGNIKTNINGAACDLRVSTQPTQFGESIVLRIHGQNVNQRQITQLGLDSNCADSLRRLLRKPCGLILITGPTGSGKSSTLYAMIKSINTHERNVITLEDPIEHTLGESVRQTAINESIGLSFARALRATLRQDPDVVMIGEIRDKDTAEMSLRMALTGHLVLATLHCDSALNAHLRLRQLGLETKQFADQLVACLSQRLVRQACSHCRYTRTATHDDGLELSDELLAQTRVIEARGCEECRDSGYSGRRPLLEILHIDEEVADLIGNEVGLYQLHRIATKKGFISLKEQARQAVLTRQLTPAEAIRTCG